MTVCKYRFSAADKRAVGVPDLGLNRSCYWLILGIFVGACIFILGIVLLARWVNRRMKKKRLDRVIPRFKYDSSREDRGYGRNIHLTEECRICLTAYVDGADVRVFLQCGHAYHARCIDEWLRLHTTCPNCRTEIQLTAPTSS
ncbi:RING/U-box superfamily protein [Artemisia annua]|uniref:RING/U-box superfamily protein n=1 Tax=Artemisia annua TaxID=35608 RepID=A0A2U1Q8V3_ARTAN|nr:RING/U-box superfamily protein [Artemisia annua]